VSFLSILTPLLTISLIPAEHRRVTLGNKSQTFVSEV
jgi:hypothetical protein